MDAALSQDLDVLEVAALVLEVVRLEDVAVVVEVRVNIYSVKYIYIFQI